MTEATEAGSPQVETLEPASGGLDALISGAIEKSGYGEDPKPETNADPAPDTAAKEARSRDENGRFAAKQDSADPEAPAKTGPADGEAQADPTKAADPAPEAQPIEPPARWSETEKAEFAKLPREAQQVLAERHKAMEADYTRKTQEVAETRKSIEPVLGEFQRLNPLLQHMGMTPQQFVAESGAVATNLLSGNPSQRAGAIAYLVQHRQVPIPELLNALGIPIPAAGENGQMAVDPTVSQLRQELTAVRTQLQQYGEQNALSERQRAEAEFNALGQSKDESGNAKFPHFERVKQAMIQLVASGQAPTWDNAYDKAVRLDDDLYKQVVETERQRVADAAEKQRQEAVNKAKKAQPVSSSSGSPKGGTQLKGLDAHLSSAMSSAWSEG